MVLIFAPGLLLAQSKLIEGSIQNRKDVEGIHILNTSSGFNSVSNASGVFEITAKTGDTLIISSIKYIAKKVPITDLIYEEARLAVTLEEMVNELQEVYLGPKLSGNIEQDIKRIKIKDTINFDDVGIPGFKGVPEEKIVPLVNAYMITAVDLEVLYKHISGYYKVLRTKRKWEAENNMAATLINSYTAQFFVEAYGIPEDRQYDFMLFCLETSEISRDYKAENFAGVLEVFAEKGPEYLKRLSEKEE